MLQDLTDRRVYNTDKTIKNTAAHSFKTVFRAADPLKKGMMTIMNHMFTTTQLEKKLTAACGKPLAQCSVNDLYAGLLSLTQELAAERQSTEGKKKLYYISAEFLIGKLLSNNLINLGIYDQVRDLLAAFGHQLSEVEELEPEPSLGNGGLGRLAACFLDSIATLGLNGDGVGLNYHFGLFKQLFHDNKQEEEPNPWIEVLFFVTYTY